MILTFLSFALMATFVLADVSHLRGSNRYYQPSPTRLQRLEAIPAPYDAAGFIPNREFNLPQEQPLFPLGSQLTQDNNQFVNNNENQIFKNIQFGLEEQSEAQQPQRTYAAPARLRQAPVARQQFQQIQEVQQVQQVHQLQQDQQFANTPARLRQLKPDQRQNRLRQRQQSQRLRQSKPARLMAAPLQEQLQQQLQPQAQFVYSAPLQQFTYNPQQMQFFTQPQPAALQLQTYQRQQSLVNPQQAQNFASAGSQSARLIDNREDAEDEEDTRPNTAASDDVEASTDNIETSPKKQDDKKVIAPQNTATVAYYPAGAFSFVQPTSANYVAAPSSYPAQYIAASSPFAQQPLTLQGAIGVPAQFQRL